MSNAVNQPIICSPFHEPKEYWYLEPDKEPIRKTGRRPSVIFPPETSQGMSWDQVPGVLEISEEFVRAYELKLVQKVRAEVKRWRDANYPGATKITLQLLKHWIREDRTTKLFFAQKEAVETIIFLREARKDFLQGFQIPLDSNPPIDTQDPEYIPKAFLRYANKMATGTGKSTVMAMIIAWNLINKSVDRKNPNYVDTVLVVVPNTTIKDRLEEIKPQSGESSIYRTRDIVPSDLIQNLNQGKVVITNWHVFEPQSMQTDGAKVIQSGVLRKSTQTIKIGTKNDTIRGQRVLTLKSLEEQIRLGVLQPTGNKKIEKGKLVSIEVVETKRTETDLAVVNRVLGRESSSKTPILVLNDEAHHAYRIQKNSNESVIGEDSENPDEESEDDSSQSEQNNSDSVSIGMDEDLIDVRESTVWMEGLDKIQKIRGIHFCVDLSATPYYIGRAGRETGKPFPWIVSDFSLMDAIESGLVKIPQLALRDSTGAEKPAYFRLWDHVMSQMTTAERGGKKAQPKPDAVLKYAHPALAMIMGEYENLRKQWKESSDPRPPVFIIICKTKKIADTIFDWISQEKTTESIPPHGIQSLKNQNGEENTIRVYSDVIQDSDSSNKSSENLWMRYTLQSVGKREWSRDLQGREVYPEGFEEIAKKLGKPMHPPGRDIRCIVSVSMLTEGWDCNTVTHIVGLRPFQSQLLCEQVVGRGLRRASYDIDESTGLFKEESSQILGVPFEVVPVKTTSTTPTPVEPLRRVYAVPSKAEFEITFPRVERYTTRVLSKINVDWASVPSIQLDPTRIPAEVELKGLSFDTMGNPSYQGPGSTTRIGLSHFRESASLQSLSWSFATNLTRRIIDERKMSNQEDLAITPHVAFPQIFSIIQTYIEKKVEARAPNDKRDVFLQPYYSTMENNINQFLHSKEEEDWELPIFELHRPDGTTKTLDKPTKKLIYPVNKSHANAIIADTDRFEQSAAFVLDGNPRVKSFVKNTGLGFRIPYWIGEEEHDYEPDFIVVVEREDGSLLNLILETKGYDFNQDVELKQAAALRWVNAVNREGSKGKWEYSLIKEISKINEEIDRICNQ